MRNRILGIDPSLSSTGWAVISIEDGRPYLLDHGALKTDSKRPHGERLAYIRASLDAVFWEYAPVIAIPKEKGFSRHARTTQALYKVHGVIEEMFAYDDGEVVDIPPTTVKKHVTGSGRASKEDVAGAVRQALGLREDYEIKTDDETDAMAVAVAYAIQAGIISEEGG